VTLSRSDFFARINCEHEESDDGDVRDIGPERFLKMCENNSSLIFFLTTKEPFRKPKDLLYKGQKVGFDKKGQKVADLKTKDSKRRGIIRSIKESKWPLSSRCRGFDSNHFVRIKWIQM